RTVCSKPTTRVGPKEVSNRGRKKKAQSYPEAPRKRQKTESVTVPHNVFSFPELWPSITAKPKHVLVPISRGELIVEEEYEKHYIEVSQLGEGGFGTVYCGYRRDDLFPVAIKHIDKDLVKYQPVVINGELRCIPLEMILMVMTAGDSVGENAVVSPLAWTDLDDEVLLIMERPENCMNLFQYNNGQIDKGLAQPETHDRCPRDAPPNPVINPAANEEEVQGAQRTRSMSSGSGSHQDGESPATR
ncbi:hypothetical protein D4764_19G0002070, partial [Takifugu flavidus]